MGYFVNEINNLEWCFESLFEVKIYMK